MRRLGQALDCDQMALYRYAERAVLLGGVAETVLAQLVIPTNGTGWETQLRTAPEMTVPPPQSSRGKIIADLRSAYRDPFIGTPWRWRWDLNSDGPVPANSRRRLHGCVSAGQEAFR